MLQIEVEKFLWLKSLKILFHGSVKQKIFMAKKFVGTFYEKELQKINQIKSRDEKAIK